MRWPRLPWPRRPTNHHPDDNDNDGTAAAALRAQAQAENERASRETRVVKRAAPRMARLPEDEFVNRTAQAFRPRPS